LRERAFKEAIQVEELVVSINPDEIIVESTYVGPKFEKIEDITPEWVLDL